jgi:hypothetical protein
MKKSLSFRTLFLAGKMWAAIDATRGTRKFCSNGHFQHSKIHCWHCCNCKVCNRSKFAVPQTIHDFTEFFSWAEIDPTWFGHLRNSDSKKNFAPSLSWASGVDFMNLYFGHNLLLNITDNFYPKTTNPFKIFHKKLCDIYGQKTYLQIYIWPLFVN